MTLIRFFLKKLIVPSQETATHRINTVNISDNFDEQKRAKNRKNTLTGNYIRNSDFSQDH